MILQLYIAGTLFILLAIVHVIFPRYFRWKEELSTISLINKEMMYVHTFFIALVVFLMGALLISSADMLVGTILGKRVCLGLSFFWMVRFWFQFFGYSSSLWRGKKKETAIHIVFAVFWLYCAVLFFMVYLG